MKKVAIFIDWDNFRQELDTVTKITQTNVKDFNTGAAGQFERWVYAGGKVLAGLQKRRKAEMSCFTTPVSAAEKELFLD